MISIMTDMPRLFDKCNLPGNRQIHRLCGYEINYCAVATTSIKRVIHKIKSPCWLHQNCSTGCAGLF